MLFYCYYECAWFELLLLCYSFPVTFAVGVVFVVVMVVCNIFDVAVLITVDVIVIAITLVWREIGPHGPVEPQSP